MKELLHWFVGGFGFGVGFWIAQGALRLLAGLIHRSADTKTPA